MRKAFLVLTVALLVIGAAGLAGCGCGGTGVNVNKDNGSININSEKGSVSLNNKTPTEAELGVPIYPNAKAVENASASYTEGQTTYTAAQFVTGDPVATVITWYKGKLSGKPGFIDMSTAEGGILSFQDGNVIRSVTVGPGSVEQQGKTVIAIMSGTGTMPQFSQ
jgi:hypothetical protein